MPNFAELIPPFAVPYGISDFGVAMGALVSEQVHSLEPRREIFGDRPQFWTGSGRQALWLILRALRLPEGAGVAVPLYCSSSVASTVRSAGLEPVFLDVDERTLTLDPGEVIRAKGRISAIIVAHLFGHVAPMNRLLEAAQGLPIIEDTAQAPLSFFGGRLAGTFGVACFYSFASSKYLPAGGGGLAAINDPDLAENVAEEAHRLTPPGWIAECRAAITQMVKAVLFRPPLYGLLGSRMRVSMESHSPLAATLNSKAILRGSAAVVLHQASGFAARVKQQCANGRFLLSRLAEVKEIILPQEPIGTTYNYHLFPVLVADEEERDAVRRGMFERGVDTSRLHFNAVACAAALGYRGGCPVSEAAASRMLTLPNHAGLSRHDLDRVATAFQTALHAHRSSVRRSAGTPSQTPRDQVLIPHRGASA